MSFRKRNAVIGVSGTAPTSPSRQQEKVLPPGTRPSPHDGRLTTSTGTSSLDQLLASHAGLPLGTSLLVEETGTTDFGGILQRYFAAEGLVQGHHVHVLGPGPYWRRELPGLSIETGASAGPTRTTTGEAPVESKMKIAWRYEALSNRHGGGTPSRGPAPSESSGSGAAPFRHAFDLTKRLEDGVITGQLHTLNAKEHHQQQQQQRQQETLFQRFVSDVTRAVETSPPTTVHRIIIPGLLSPTIYSPSASHPQQVLQFLHALRGLLRRFPSRLAALVSLPAALYPRSAGLTRRIELLFDGVIEIIPLQHELHQGPPPRSSSSSHSSTSKNDGKHVEQGLLRIHSLPVFHEKGGGLEGSWVKEDMSFKMSASNGLVITPFSLPPLLDTHEGEADKSAAQAKAKEKALEF